MVVWSLCLGDLPRAATLAAAAAEVLWQDGEPGAGPLVCRLPTQVMTGTCPTV